MGMEVGSESGDEFNIGLGESRTSWDGLRGEHYVGSGEDELHGCVCAEALDAILWWFPLAVDRSSGR